MRYETGIPVGRGAAGEVLKAWDPTLDATSPSSCSGGTIRRVAAGTAHRIRIRNGGVGAVVSLHDSLAWDNGTDLVVGPGVTASHDLDGVDPLFVDPTGGDYRLGEGSPAIDTGDASLPGVQPLDLDGAPRVQGAATDVGAYQNSSDLIFHDDFESGTTAGWSSAVGG